VALGCTDDPAEGDGYYCVPHRAAVSGDPPAPCCVFCPSPLAGGDTIACPDHRRQMDLIPMPWEAAHA
jgi:hypothetical protein